MLMYKEQYMHKVICDVTMNELLLLVKYLDRKCRVDQLSGKKRSPIHSVRRVWGLVPTCGTLQRVLKLTAASRICTRTCAITARLWYDTFLVAVLWQVVAAMQWTVGSIGLYFRTSQRGRTVVRKRSIEVTIRPQQCRFAAAGSLGRPCIPFILNGGSTTRQVFNYKQFFICKVLFILVNDH